MGLESFSEKIEKNAKVILTTSFIMLVIVVAVAIIFFFYALQPADQVMVPNVVGKELNTALLELQARELNARLQLRYSNNADDEGTVLDQRPGPGSIVKTGRKVEIIVSNGTVAFEVEDYVGKNIQEVKQNLQVVSTSASRYPIILNEPFNYKFDEAPSGTILSQDPPAGTEIKARTVFSFVVSKGPENEMAPMPALTGANLNKLYEIMANTKLRFNFSMDKVESAGAPTVVNQAQEEGSSLNVYSYVDVKLEAPEDGKRIYGVYSIDLPNYPYPLDLAVDVINLNGERTQLLSCKHPGGNFTFPYGLSKGSILVLTVLGKEVQTISIE